MNGPKVMRGTWLFAGLALVLSAAREAVLRPPPVVALTATASPWTTGGFRPGGVFPGTDSAGLPHRVRSSGSWIDGDGWQGEAATAWLPARPGRLRVLVAGYPAHAGCALRIE